MLCDPAIVLVKDARRGREGRGDGEATEMANRLMVLLGMLALMTTTALPVAFAQETPLSSLADERWASRSIPGSTGGPKGSSTGYAAPPSSFVSGGSTRPSPKFSSNPGALPRYPSSL